MTAEILRVEYVRIWRRGGETRACGNRCVALVKSPYHRRRLVEIYYLLEAIFDLENSRYGVEAPGTLRVENDAVLILCNWPCTLKAGFPSMTGYPENTDMVDDVVLFIEGSPHYPGSLLARCEPRGWRILEPFGATLPPRVTVEFSVSDEPAVTGVGIPPARLEDARRLLRSAIEYQATGKVSDLGVECRCLDKNCFEIVCSCDCVPAASLEEGARILREAVNEYLAARGYEEELQELGMGDDEEEYLRVRICSEYLEASQATARR